MNSRKCILILLLAALIPFAYAENVQAIVPYDSPVFDELTSIYLEAGKTMLTTAGPFSVDELRLMLERIEPAKLSPAGKRAYDDISKTLNAMVPDVPSGLHFELHYEAALQGYLHTNTDPATTYWEYVWADRLPVLSLPIEAWAGDIAYGILDLSLRQTHDAYDPSRVRANYTNVPFDLDYIDLEQPFRAFLALGGHNWSFVIGRDRFSWGNGETSNFALSDSPDFYDFARFTGYWGNFKYTAMWVSLVSNLAPYSYSPQVTAAELLAGYTFQDYPRNYFLHRLDFSLLDNLSLGVTEGTLIGGVQPKLTFFNPLMIFHDLYNYYNASEILAVELTWALFQYVEVYGQFSSTQIQTFYELWRYGQGASTVPNAWGGLLGIRARWPLADGFMDDGIEFAYLNPWMYIKENPLTTYEWWRFQFSNLSGSAQWVSSPLGYFTGPDSIITEIWARYRVPSSFSVGVSYMLEIKGANTLDTPYEESTAAASLATPSGIVEYKNVVHMAGTMDPLPFMSLGLDLYGIITQNFGNSFLADVMDLQVITTVRFRI